MPRPLSRIAPDWRYSTAIDAEIIRDAGTLGPEDLLQLSRPLAAPGPRQPVGFGATMARELSQGRSGTQPLVIAIGRRSEMDPCATTRAVAC